MTSLISAQGIVMRLAALNPLSALFDDLGTTHVLKPNFAASTSLLSICPTCKTNITIQLRNKQWYALNSRVAV